jgi:chromosome segregation ATPase
MIESIMYFGGGFLVASLLAIILISFVHQRAVRLTQRRLADAIPVSMAEIQADKDHLRAEFALSSRRLEMAVEQLKAKATAQLTELARKTEAISLLKAELLERTAVTDELAGKAKILGGKLTQTEQENLEKVTALEATARALAGKDAEIANAANMISALHHAADTQRVEVAVLRTQIEDLKSQIGDMEHATDNTVQRLLSEQSTAEGVHQDLFQARQTIEMLYAQVARLEHELAARANALDDRAAHIGEFDARLAEQGQLLRQREAEALELRQELAITTEQAAAAVERLRSAKAAVETQLQTANDMLSERAGRIADMERRIADGDRLLRQRDAEAQALNREIATLKDEAGAARAQWAGENTAFEAQLAAKDQSLAARAGRISEFERQVADFERQVADFERLLSQRAVEAGSLNQEIAALREEAATATALWHGQKTSFEGLLAGAHDTLAERAGRIGAFEQQAVEFERMVSQRDAEAQALGQEISTLKGEAAAAAQQWRADKAALEAQLESLTGTSTEQASRIEGFRQQVAESEQLLAQREAEAKALHQEIAALNREAETSWKAERSENALLRERIGDVAAQIAHMTMTLEKSGSPIGAILADSTNGIGGGEVTAPRPGNLIDRIRALQSGASRISTAS